MGHPHIYTPSNLALFSSNSFPTDIWYCLNPEDPISFVLWYHQRGYLRINLIDINLIKAKFFSILFVQVAEWQGFCFKVHFIELQNSFYKQVGHLHMYTLSRSCIILVKLFPRRYVVPPKPRRANILSSVVSLARLSTYKSYRYKSYQSIILFYVLSLVVDSKAPFWIFRLDWSLMIRKRTTHNFSLFFFV